MVPGAGNVVAAVTAVEKITLNVFPDSGVTLNGAPPENATVPVQPVGGTTHENATVPTATGATREEAAAGVHTGVCETTAGMVTTTLGSTSCAALALAVLSRMTVRPVRTLRIAMLSLLR
jgi:hypothetical protein